MYRYISEIVLDRAIVTMKPRLYAICRMVLFTMILSDLQWFSEIFSDTKHRAVSLQQLSYLLP